VKLTVRVIGHAVEFFPDRKTRYEIVLDEPARISEILERLGVGQALVMAVVVDGKRREFDFQPPDGAEIILITPPAGG
jgi:hypothetical protein